MSLICVKNLHKTYFTDGVETPVLRNIFFDIDKGDFVAIMGPSGSGKSTLLHILGFLDSATEGQYLFEGKQFDAYSQDERAHVRNTKMGFVFQAFNLLPRNSVFDNVRLPLLYSSTKEREWKARTEDAIKSVGLEQRRNYAAYKLSGGEKQRVAIARALVNNPNIIFADEPTGNLDSKSGRVVMEILQELNDKRGHTIILITHETYTAQNAKRVIRIKDGQIGSDEEVKRRKSARKRYQK